MKTIYLDPIGGVAGDMLLAALLDAGGDEDYLLANLQKLDLPGWTWHREETTRGGFGGTKIDFNIVADQHCRHLPEIIALIQKAKFPKEVEGKILATFDILAEAEAKAHRIPKAEIHFHEVGAADTILDICGVVLMLYRIGVEEIISRPLPMGNDTVHCEHGEIPLPAPAVAAMLEGVAVRRTNIKGETVTPTGMALLKAYGCQFGDFPTMTVNQSGCGCGTRDGETPNILRVFIGETEERAHTPYIYRIETTIDDMTGEELGFLWEHLYEAGANDMYYTPVYMKKGRPAVKLTVLTEESALADVRNAIFTHTSTLGMICQKSRRFVLNRRFETVKTPFGEVHYKVAKAPNGMKVKAEYEDLRSIAEKEGISLKKVRQICDAAYLSSLSEHSD